MLLEDATASCPCLPQHCRLVLSRLGLAPLAGRITAPHPDLLPRASPRAFVDVGKSQQRSRLARAGYSELDMPYIEDVGPPQEQGAGGAMPPGNDTAFASRSDYTQASWLAFMGGRRSAADTREWKASHKSCSKRDVSTAVAITFSCQAGWTKTRTAVASHSLRATEDERCIIACCLQRCTSEPELTVALGRGMPALQSHPALRRTAATQAPPLSSAPMRSAAAVAAGTEAATMAAAAAAAAGKGAAAGRRRWRMRWRTLQRWRRRSLAPPATQRSRGTPRGCLGCGRTLPAPPWWVPVCSTCLVMMQSDQST